MQQGLFIITKTKKYKIGDNILVNRLSVLNNLIPLDWLNLSHESYNLKIKGSLLPVKCNLQIKSKRGNQLVPGLVKDQPTFLKNRQSNQI